MGQVVYPLYLFPNMKVLSFIMPRLHHRVRVFLVPVFVFIFQSPLAADDFSHLSGAGKNRQVDALSFTNTLHWDREYLGYTKWQTHYLKTDWKKSFSLSSPPANSSARTKAELEYLVKLIPKRGDQQKEIEAEVLVAQFRWGGFTYKGLTEGEGFKNTSKLLMAAHRDMGIVCFTFKQHFNRVRPSTLAKKIGTNIDTAVAIPGHPAYPSGHATEAFTIAYILQELDPKNAETYLKDALRIAQNREVGGLHYPSDTEAGRLLARQITDSLLANPRFQLLLNAARSEW